MIQHIEDQLIDILDSSRFLLSDIKPSEWAELNRIMTSDVSPIAGPFSYSYTPYAREIADCFSYNHPARVIAVMKGAQIGLALHVNTPIMTTEGWKTMKDVQIGDFVFDEKGKPCRVNKTSGIYEDRICYDVYFTDGSVIKCDADHLWTVHDLKNVKRTLATKIIKERFKKLKGSGRHRNRYNVKNCEPVFFQHRTLPIDPYLLGLWLGDGHTNSNRITAIKNDAEEYQSYLKLRGIDTTIRPYKNQPGIVNLTINNTFNSWKGGTNYYGNKHIPFEYKTASIQQRLELLQGLIDTDGHVTNNGSVQFYNCNKRLIDDVIELISSLGYKVTIRERDNTFTEVIKGKRYKNKKMYVLNFMGTLERPPARLKRKASRLKPIQEIRGEINKRWISDVRPCDSVPVKCISIDSETHLYLAGKTFIPTHNSTGVLENVIGWIISQNPGNILFLTGHSDLAEEAMNKKIDQMIDSSGLRPLIRASVQRAKNGRTGDTNKSKEFPGGSLIAGSASNHKLLRQRSVQYIFVDDFDAAKKSTKESGSTRKMIEQRAAAYYSKMKILYGSTPELKLTSNIEPVYLLGDQRRFMLPCPCCGEFIPLFWEVDMEHGGKDKAGIHWEMEDSAAFQVANKLAGTRAPTVKPGSVRYRCQKCGDSFDDSKKQSMLDRGYWQPTATPSEAGYYSYHISSLYAPPGMYDWEFYVRQYLEANPPGGTRKEELHKTFVNLVLGEPYEQQGAAPKANAIQQNIRNYPIGTIPEQISIKDGNGSIIMLTCACDLNGTEQDARLDFEVVAWSESGASYSVKHGSIGTFIPREGEKKVKADRERWTYEHKRYRSVWPELEAVLNTIWLTDSARKMKILVSGVDCGHYTNHAYAFIDSTKCNVFGLKGEKEGTYRKNNVDLPIFKPARERARLFLLDVNYIKDRLSETMKLNWDPGTGEPQPPDFMNYPTPSAGLYLFGNFFRHYESEHRVIEVKDGEGVASRWTKKSSQDPNHFWDVRVYNEGLREIWATLALRQTEQKTGNWPDFVKQVLSK